jgi:outer membrane receptor for ferrienterochelin and colicins
MRFFLCVLQTVVIFGASVTFAQDVAQDEAPIEDEGPVENNEEGPLSQEVVGQDEEKDDKGEDDEADNLTIVVTGTRQARNIDEAPVRIQVVNRDTIEARKSRSLADTLKHTSGVRLETNCQNCGFTQLRINGLEGYYTQILIDGLPSFSGLAGVYGLEQVPVEMIERVEIVKGGGSALYGTSAVAGVVNVITRRPLHDFGHVHVVYESVALREPGIRVKADGFVSNDDQSAGLFLFASSYRREGVDLNNDGFTELVKLRQVAGGANGYWLPGEGLELEFRFHMLKEYRRGGDNLEAQPHDAEIAEELQTERLQGELRLSHKLSQALDYKLSYAVAHTERSSYYGGGGSTTPDPPTLPVEAERYQEFLDAFDARSLALGGYGRTQNPSQTADGHINANIGTSRPLVLTAGAQLQVDDINDTYLGYDRVIDETYKTLGIYLQKSWLFASWGESVVGARVDKHSELEDPVLSPRVALKLEPTNGFRFRTSVSSGFRAPQAFDEDLHIDIVGGAPRLIENAPDLKAERSLSYAQQVELARPLGESWDGRIALNGYLTHIDDAFVVNERDDPATPEEEALRENRGAATVTGVEIEGEIAWRNRLKMRAGWTLERAENETPDEDFGETHLFRTPTHYGYLESTLRIFEGRLLIQSGLDITGPMRTPRLDSNGDPLRVERSPWFYDMSFNITGFIDLGDNVFLEPFVGLQNALDSRQVDFDSGPARDSNYIYGPATPRTATVGLGGGF